MRRLAIVLALLGCGHGGGSGNGSGIGSGIGSGSGSGIGSGIGSSLGSGIGSGSGNGIGSGSSSSSGAPVSDVIETLGDNQPSVLVMDAGKEPRRVLTYGPHAGTRTAKLAFTIGTGAGEPEGATLALAWKIPAAIAGAFELGVTKADGRIPADAKGGERDVIAAVWGAYASIKARVRSDAQGRAKFERTAGLTTQPSMLWLLDLLIVPLPAEAIGVGATWKVDQVLTIPDAHGDVERVYQVTAIKGDRVEIEVQGATEWKGAGSDDRKMVEQLDGKLVVQLSDLLPANADVTVRQDMGPIQPLTHLVLGP